MGTSSSIQKTSTIGIHHAQGEVPSPEIQFRFYSGAPDHPILAKLSQEYWDSIKLEFVMSAEEVGRAMKYTENLNPWRNVLLAEIAGKPVGFTQVHWFQEINGPRIYRHFTRVIPEGMRQGVNRPLLRFAESRLRELARRHPKNLEKLYSTIASNSDMQSSRLFESNGYLPERYFIDMVRPLDLAIPDIGLPDGIDIRQTKPEHYQRIFAALNEAFLDHWAPRPITEAKIQWFMESDQFQPHLWKVAWEGDEVVGVVLNYIDESQNRRFERKRGYTEDIAVRKPWRRKGVASALIASSLRELKNLGMKEAALGVDTQNLTGALRLYESLGYQEVRMYTSYQKPLMI